MPVTEILYVLLEEYVVCYIHVIHSHLSINISEHCCVFRLLTPPGTPLFPSLEMESQKTVMGQIGTPKTRPAALKSRVRPISGSIGSLSGLFMHRVLFH